MRNRLGVISLLLSISVFIAAGFINADISQRYQNADGKTRALFGLVEYLDYSWKYYLLIPAAIALIIALLSFNKNENRVMSTVATVITLITIALLILPVWKLFVNTK